jgi:hypothetical protein
LYEADEIRFCSAFDNLHHSTPPPLGSTATNILQVPLRTYS